MKPRYIVPVLLALLLCTTQAIAQDPDPEWARKNGWFFENFSRDTLPWSMFRETFIGVAPAPSADFDQIFYNELYQTKLAGPGVCYGMCVMALLMKKNGGQFGYCHPPYMYSGGALPDDPNLETAIEIVHGYQTNHGFLSFSLDVIAANAIRDGAYAFAKVQEYLAKNDPPTICISATAGGIFGDEGHCIVAYAATDVGGVKKIWVYDPNRSWYVAGPGGQDWYTSHQNFILISGNSWSFNMADGTPYSGDPGSGGRIIAAPLSVAGRKDRLPQSLLAEGAFALNTILLYGNVKLTQATDAVSGRQLLNDAGTDIELREDRRMKNMFGIIPYSGGTRAPGKANNQTFYFKGKAPVQLHFVAIGEYKIGMHFQGKYYEMRGTGAGEPLVFKPEGKYLKLGKRGF